MKKHSTLEIIRTGVVVYVGLIQTLQLGILLGFIS